MKHRLLPCLAAAFAITAVACAGLLKKPDPPKQEEAEPKAEAKLELKPEPIIEEKPPEKPKPKIVWASPDQSVKLGDLTVGIIFVKQGKVLLTDIFGKAGTSKDSLVSVCLRLENVNPEKKLHYDPWSGRISLLQGPTVRLKDDLGNTYRKIRFATGSIPTGAQKDAVSLYPAKAIADVLVFEEPIAAAKHLDLELPAESYGAKGMVRFRIPAGKIERD